VASEHRSNWKTWHISEDFIVQLAKATGGVRALRNADRNKTLFPLHSVDVLYTSLITSF